MAHSARARGEIRRIIGWSRSQTDSECSGIKINSHVQLYYLPGDHKIIVFSPVSLHVCWVFIWCWKYVKTNGSITGGEKNTHTKKIWLNLRFNCFSPWKELPLKKSQWLVLYQPHLSWTSWRVNWAGWSPRRSAPEPWRCNARRARVWGEPWSWCRGPRSGCASGHGGAVSLHTGSGILENKDQEHLKFFQTIYLHKTQQVPT